MLTHNEQESCLEGQKRGNPEEKEEYSYPGTRANPQST